MVSVLTVFMMALCGDDSATDEEQPANDAYVHARQTNDGPPVDRRHADPSRLDMAHLLHHIAIQLYIILVLLLPARQQNGAVHLQLTPISRYCM